MRILVACEESQEVCKAFRARGHEAYSCDIEDCSGGHPEWHVLGDVSPLINGNCTFRTTDGAEHSIRGGVGHDYSFPTMHLHDECKRSPDAGKRRNPRGQIPESHGSKGVFHAVLQR